MRKRCRYPLCVALLDNEAKYCPKHIPKAVAKYEMYSRLYDQQRRIDEPHIRAFYSSAEWKKVRDTVINSNPICQQCGKAFAYLVHHTIEISTQEGWDKRLEPSLLQSVCNACHNAIHNKRGRRY